MLFVRIYKTIIPAIVVFFLQSGLVFALEIEDGFGSAGKIESKHFVVYYTPQVDIAGLVQRLNISPSDRLLAGQAINRGGPYESELAEMLDTLFMQVCDILDMQLYSFQGNIKICQDSGQLNKIYNGLFNRGLTANSFYVYSFNTIYISMPEFKREILGHEIAHAIISHYFVVQPPIKIQEILAQYTEYNLRKAK
jgi:hypothetical protein